MRWCAWLVFGVLAFGSAAAVTVETKKSECLPPGDADGREGTVTVEVRGCSVFVFHRGVVTNCCLDFQAKVSVEGSLVELREIDAGPPCDCICPFDLEARIDGLEPGRYTLRVVPLDGAEPLEFAIEIPPCEGFWLIGSEVWSSLGTPGVVVPVLATNEKPVEGFSFGTTFPLEHARFVEVDLEGTITGELGPELFVVEIDDGAGGVTPGATGWATCSAIFDFERPFEGKAIPPGAGWHLVNLVYDLLPPSGSIPRSMSVPFVAGLGKPPVPVVYTVGGQDVIPEIRSGIIQLTFPPTFIRGDANDNGILSISDPIYLLNYLFRGGPIPPCGDAADANDDGEIDIADVVRIVVYLFAEGTIPPPSPPGPPGFDPTLDGLGCARGG